MLNFTSRAEVNLIIDYLDSLAYDDAKNLEILNASGFIDADSEGAPEEPALDLFDKHFNFASLRQKLESIEAEEDATGQDLSTEINKIIFWEPVIGSLINEKNEIRICNLIYKYIDDDRMVVFRAGDQALLDLVRSTADPFTIENQYNFFKIDTRKKQDVELYKKIEQASMNSECLFALTWSNTGNEFFFNSIGFFPIGGNVIWKVIDANGNVLSTQNGLHEFNYLIPIGITYYPLYISIESEGCAPHVELFAQISPNTGYNCDLFDFDFTFDPILPGKLYFTIPAHTPITYWIFGDMSNYTSPASGNVPIVISHTFSGGGQYNVCATVQTETCHKTVCKQTGDINCGDYSTFKKMIFEAYNINGSSKAVRYKFNLKDPLFAETRFFAKIKSLRQIVQPFFAFKVPKLRIDWNSTPGESHILYYTSGCIPVNEIAIKEAYNKSKLKAIRKAPNGAKIRKIDGSCNFRLYDASQVGYLFNLSL